MLLLGRLSGRQRRRLARVFPPRLLSEVEE